jgi:small subunit ribosomal protein S20
MPQHKSAKKRVKTSLRKKERNKVYKTKLKNVIKKVREEEVQETAAKSLVEATSVLDKLVSKGIIHKNKAANQKSKLAKAVNKLAAGKKS